MVFVTGDLHGNIDKSKLNSKNFPQQKVMTKDDFVIIAGDFGGIWDESRSENWLLKWLERKSFTTLFIDGNHENFDLLEQYPVSYWNGGKVRKIRPSIFHLMRGQVFQIDGMKLFAFGGADSIDKQFRKEGESWWPQEIPTEEEYEEGISNLKKHGMSVDVVITHTAPQNVVEQLGYLRDDGKFIDPTTMLLSRFQEVLIFKHWYFGHFHEEKEMGKYTALYHEIKQIDLRGMTRKSEL